MHGIRCGELLTEAKSQCKHGEWLPWPQRNFEGAPRTAQGYMRLYNHRDEIRGKAQHSAHLSIRGALAELSAPKDDEEQRAEENKGETVDEATDEQVAELVRDWMKLAGPTELSEVEQEAMDRRLARPGKAERDLLKDLHYHYMEYLIGVVAQDTFLIEERNAKEVIEWRSEDKKQLYRLPLPKDGQRLDETHRRLIQRGAKVIAVFKFHVWRALSNWFADMLIAEVDDVKQVRQRLQHNADWRRAEMPIVLSRYVPVSGVIIHTF